MRFPFGFGVIFALAAAGGCGDGGSKPSGSTETGGTRGNAGGSAGSEASAGAGAAGTTGSSNDGGGASSSGGTVSSAGGAGGAFGGAGAAGGSAGAAGGSASCPSGASGQPPESYLLEFGSGSRLQARFLAAPGMPQVFAGFYDTELEAACDFLIASDDELRCLPRETVRSRHIGYLNADCTGDIWTASPACAAEPGFVRTRLECADKFDVHPLVPYVGSSVFLGNSQDCVDQRPGSLSDAYAADSAMAPENFVRGSVRELVGVCRAALAIVEAEDGARGPLHVLDVETGAACETGAGSCWPARRAFEEPMFSDAMCTMETSHATWSNAASCALPHLIRPMASGYFYRPGALVTEPVYSNLSGGCEPALDKPWITTIYELGERVEEADLAVLTSEPSGDGRLQAWLIAEDSTALIASSAELYDSELGENCVPGRFEDGELYCIPSNQFGGEAAFNDPECTQPVRACHEEMCLGRVVYDVATDLDSCASEHLVVNVWRTLSQATGYYGTPGGGPCVELGQPEDFHWVVEAVAESELPPLSLAVAD